MLTKKVPPGQAVDEVRFPGCGLSGDGQSRYFLILELLQKQDRMVVVNLEAERGRL